MKKIIIALLVIVAIIATLPFVGNKLAKETIEQRVELLKSYGMEVVEETTESSYLNTKTHYKFMIEDEKKFITYLQQFSQEQFPPYINAMLKGVTIGTDIAYSNIPISDDISVDIYPLKLSTELMNEIQNEDAKLFKYIEAFLESKGILYHINYNIVSSDFDGYIKDIALEYTLDDNTLIKLDLKNATYSGSGPLIAPTKLISNIDAIVVTLSKDSDKMVFNLGDFSSSANFESQSTYVSDAKLKDFNLNVLTQDINIVADIKNASINASSNTQGEKAEMYMKSSIEKIDFYSKQAEVNATNLNYDISISDVDKDSLEELRLLVADANSDITPEVAEKLRVVVIKLLSKGLTFDIPDLSVEKIILDKTQDLEGLKIKSNLVLKADPDFAQKVEQAPMMLADSLDVKVNFKVSKPIFEMIGQMTPMAFVAQGYAKEEGNSLVYDITFVKGELLVNGKALQ